MQHHLNAAVIINLAHNTYIILFLVRFWMQDFYFSRRVFSVYSDLYLCKTTEYIFQQCLCCWSYRPLVQAMGWTPDFVSSGFYHHTLQQFQLLVKWRKQNPTGMDPLTLLLTERLVPQTNSHVFLCCLRLLAIVLYGQFHITGIQYKCNCLCDSTTLQLARTVHTCNNAYSTKTSPKLYSIILWCPMGDYYVTSGSALQSFHHCNCTL